MAPVSFTVGVLAKISIKVLGPSLYNGLISSELGKSVLKNIIDEGASHVASYTTKKLSGKDNAEPLFEELLYKELSDAISKAEITEEESERREEDFRAAINTITIPVEYCLGDGLSNYLCEQYQKLAGGLDETVKEVFNIFGKGYKSLLLKYADQDTFRKSVDTHITNLKNDIEQLSNKISPKTDTKAELANYLNKKFKVIKRQFEEKNESAVGNESLSESYIPATVEINGENKDLLQYIYQEYKEGKNNVLVLHGLPGHGKTTFCKNAVYEYNEKHNWGADVPGMLYVSLNPSDSYLFFTRANEIGFNIDNLFESEKKISINPDDCSGMIVFLDGYDEAIEYLRENNISSFSKFLSRVKDSADFNNIFYVITSRTNALPDEIIKQSYTYSFANLTFNQQKNWCLKNETYTDYWNQKLKPLLEEETQEVAKKEFQNLLGIPVIFRMVVHSRFETGTDIPNRAKLYDALFHHIMTKKGVDYNKISLYEQAYRNHAYKIWRNDNDMAIPDTDMPSNLPFSYYFKIKRNGNNLKMGFLHRSFYEYYLAYFFYEHMKQCIGDECANLSANFMALLGERILSEDILCYLADICINSKEDKNIMDEVAKNILTVLEETEAITLNIPAPEPHSTSTKLKYDRCNTIFVNTINICKIFNIEKYLDSLEQIKSLLIRYNCSWINFSNQSLNNLNLYRARLSSAVLRNSYFIGADLNRAVLYEAQLEGAHLDEADLQEAQLDKAYMKNAYFKGAHLEEAHLRWANLQEAHLEKARLYKAKLRNSHLEKAHLEEADLEEANLAGAHLEGAHLEGAHLEGAHLESAHLEGAHLEGAYLERTHIEWADFTNADLSNTTIIDTDFSEALIDNTKFDNVKAFDEKLLELINEHSFQSK